MLNKTDFLFAKKEIKPYLLFMQLIYLHLFNNFEDSRLFLVGAIGFSIVLKRNYYWYAGVMLSPGLGKWQPINLFFGLLTCNQLSTTLFFCYTVLNSWLLNDFQINLVFNLLSLLGLAFFIWSTLPLQQVSKNQALFVSISILWALYGVEYTQSLVETPGKQLEYIFVMLLPVVGFSSYAIITSRVKEVVEGTMEELTCAEQVVLFIENKKAKLFQKLEKIGIKSSHEIDCKLYQGFCSSGFAFDQKFEAEYILYLYKQGFMKFTRLYEQYALHESYINFLLEHEMFPKALEAHLRFKSKSTRFSLFLYCYSKRIDAKLEDYFQHLKDRYVHKSAYSDYLKYESDFQILRGNLLDLSELKMKFWDEINCNNAKVVNIRKLGLQFLRDINKMHQFYLKQICQFEKQAIMFAGGVIYNLFLLTATNYKDVAEANIKQMKKLSDSIFQHDLKTSHKAYTVKVSAMDDKLGIIQNTSKSFNTVVDFPGSRAELLYRPISEFIPPVYVSEHERGFRNLHKISIGKFMGRKTPSIFLFTKKEKLYPCSMILKYSTDIINELSIIAVINRNRQTTESIVTDFNGNFKYSTKKPERHQKILSMPQVQAAIKRFTEKWGNISQQHQPYPVLEAIKIETAAYEDQSVVSVIVDSPLSQSFRYPNSPPIHLSIIDEMSINYTENSFLDDGQLGCARKLNKIMDQVDTDSQTSSMTRRPEVISVLKKFEGASQLKIFNLLMVFVAAIFVIGMVFICVQTYLLNFLKSEEGQIGQNTQFALTVTVFDLENKIGRVISKGLSIYGIEKGLIESDRYAETYGVQDYVSKTKEKIRGYCSDIRQIVSNKMTLDSTKPKQNFYGVLNQKMKIQTQNRTQYISYSGLLRKFVLDCYDMANSKGIQQVVSGMVYWQTIFPQTSLLIDVLQEIDENNINNLSFINTLLVVLFCVILLMFAVSLFMFTRKLARQENSIYEMLVSLEQELINQQITELIDFSLSLKSKTTTTFTQTHLKNSNILRENMSQNNDKQHSSLIMSSTHRKRKNGSLDKTGYSRKRIPMYIFLLVFILLICGIAVCKSLTLQQMASNLKQISNRNIDINQRLILQVNIKKYVFKYQQNELIEGKTVANWTKDMILLRKLEYDTSDDPTPETFKCQENNIICNSTALNSQLAINMFFQNLATQTDVTLSPHQLPLMELLEQISYGIQGVAIPKKQMQEAALLNFYEQISTFLSYSSWVLCAIMCVLTFMYIKNLKKEFIMLIWMVSFLNEDMICKNKRVHSFLQRLSKEQR